MIQLASIEDCTGCGACSYVCSQSAIELKSNKIGVILPEIDHGKCIECGLCRKICPAINPPIYLTPQKCYAAWSNDTEERKTSASGGIASVAYRNALSLGFDIAGAIQKKDFSVEVVLSQKENDIVLFKNSKYVFSSINELLPQIKENIRFRKKTLVIALPCQIAAIRKCFPNNSDLLILADVVCHGCTPFDYLIQHIKFIEGKVKKKAIKMSFRDPAYGTYTYTFTLYDKDGKEFYAKRTKDGDYYQIGYHRMISYRENCFHCHYARPERVGDFTLADFSGLGNTIPFDYNRINCSCIMVNNNTGQQFISHLIDNNSIIAFERPINEAINGNRQLRLPCKKNQLRKIFEVSIANNNGDFEAAMEKVLSYEKRTSAYNKLLATPQRVFRVLKRAIKALK